MVRVNRPFQCLVVVALTLVLLVPVGAIGISQLLNPDGQEQESPSATDADNPENRPTVDPAEQLAARTCRAPRSPPSWPSGARPEPRRP